MSAAKFVAELENIAESRIPLATSQAVRATGLTIYGSLIDNPDNGGTPIKTGYARSSWNISTGQPVGKLAAPTRDKNGSYSPDSSPQLQITKEKIEDIYITNAVPYIVFLNQGSSKQAPAMFIERAIERGTGVKLEKV